MAQVGAHETQLDESGLGKEEEMQLQVEGAVPDKKALDLQL